MHARRMGRLTLLVTSLVLVHVGNTGCSRAQQAKPNILFLLADDLDFDRAALLEQLAGVGLAEFGIPGFDRDEEAVVGRALEELGTEQRMPVPTMAGGMSPSKM